MNHDGGHTAYAPCHVLTTWPKGSFVENIAVDATGVIFVTLHTDRAVVRVDPQTGVTTPFATFATPVAGLVFGVDGHLYVSGGQPGQAPGVIWRVDAAGSVSKAADLPQALFLNGMTVLRADDFAAGADGSLFIATHPARSLLRLAPDGTRTTLAGPDQGMTGATAVAFGRSAHDLHCVYVTTTGGTMTLPDDQLEPAKLVRVEVGISGATSDRS